jgi:SWI/SNF-related matrix-associated actin-dependent regulator of chromatin subfamily A-like protein 1
MTNGEELYPYQTDGVETVTRILRGSKDRAALLADAPGLGKTPQAVHAALRLDARRVLVVCPASLRLNWARELARWSDGRYEPLVLRSGKDAPAAGRADVLVASYPLVVRQPTLGTLLAAEPFDLLVFDESHALKSPSAQVSRVCLVMLWSHARHRLCLTGTPVPNGRAAEAFTVFSRMAPDLFSPWDNYRDRYCIEAANPNDPRPGAVWYPRSKNLDELGRLARERFMVRRTRSVIADQLPPVVRERFYLDVPELHAGENAELRRDLTDPDLVERIVAAVRGGRDPSAVPSENDPVSTVRRKLGALKVRPAVEYLLDLIGSGTPRVVVFCHHRDVWAGLSEALRADPAVDAVFGINGATPAGERQAAVDGFQALKGTDRSAAFVASIGAAATGLTLTAADTVVFAEWDWVPSTNQQAEARVARLTQQSTGCRAIYLVVPETLDEAVLGAVQRKQRDIAEVLAA